MAANTPVLERTSATEKIPSRNFGTDYVSEQEHNARIRDTYAKLINPNYSLDEVFAREEAAMAREKERIANNFTKVDDTRVDNTYLVRNARADAAIFRAESPVNAVTHEEEVALAEEENEDLRPTSTAIQYKTVGQTARKTGVYSVTESKRPLLGKKEKTIIAIFVAVVVALLALVIINSAVIASLDSQITNVQSNIDTVRGAIAGVNSNIADIISAAVGK